MDKSHASRAVNQRTAILLFERGAGENEGFTAVERADDPRVQRRQPRHTIGVGQWCAAAHFRDVLR